MFGVALHIVLYFILPFELLFHLGETLHRLTFGDSASYEQTPQHEICLVVFLGIGSDVGLLVFAEDFCLVGFALAEFERYLMHAGLHFHKHVLPSVAVVAVAVEAVEIVCACERGGLVVLEGAVLAVFQAYHLPVDIHFELSGFGASEVEESEHIALEGE